MPLAAYHWVDVFASRPFEGVPLVVFPEGSGLDPEQMQLLAREIGRTEAAFLLEPTLPGADVGLRVFTPGGEVVPEGHAVLGAHYVRALLQPGCLTEPLTLVRQESAGQLTEVELQVRRGEVSRVSASFACQGLSAPFQDPAPFAAALGIPMDRIGPGELRPCVVRLGQPWLMIPLVDLLALRALVLDPRRVAELARLSGARSCFAFTLETVAADATAHGRLLACGDPASAPTPISGAAAGAVGLYLLAQQVLLAAPSARLAVEQGHQAGRPGVVDVEVFLKQGQPDRVKVGGQVIHVGLGRFERDVPGN